MTPPAVLIRLYVCMYIFIYICTYTDTHLCIYLYAYIHISIYKFIYICTYTYTHLYMYVYAYVYILRCGILTKATGYMTAPVVLIHTSMFTHTYAHMYT